jgi:hypothetical protein
LLRSQGKQQQPAKYQSDQKNDTGRIRAAARLAEPQRSTL